MTDSNIQAINDTLLKHNPFAQPPFVNANNVWGKSFPDVEKLNAHASDTVFRALEDIREGHFSSASIVISAQNGTGKTHIISRIRHRLQDQGGALFIYAGKFSDINQIKQGFQQLLADSLSNIGSQGVKQWQELATAMTNDVSRAITSNAKCWEPKDLVKKFENVDLQKMSAWIGRLTKEFQKIRSVQDPDIVRAIFWTLVEGEASYASNWLAGKELAQFKSNELRLPSQNQSFEAILQILDLISQYYELVVCFDELDSPDISDSGLYRAQVVAGLVKDLFENLKRGVILSVMMPGIWSDKLQRELPKSVSCKMTTYCNPLELEYLNSETTIDLVSMFLESYYETYELNPPNPIYPFTEDQLRAIGREKPTVREVLQWCREHCKPQVALPDDSSGDSGKDQVPIESEDISGVELAFTNELSENIKSIMDDNNVLADALFFSLKNLEGEVVEGFEVQEVTTAVGKRGGKDNYLKFKVIGEDNDEYACIGVAVLQHEGGKALGAGLRRLLDEENKFDLTRGCLVRSKSKPINSYFKTTYLNPLIESGGEFAALKEDEIKPLIAIQNVYQKRELEYNVTEEEIQRFIAEKGAQYWLGQHNPLLQEILSDPSYQVPSDIEDEPEFEDEFLSDEEDSVPEDLSELIHA